PATQFAIKEMNSHFKKMKQICKQAGADLIFVNLPANQFTGHHVVRAPIDKIVIEHLFHNNKIDSIYQSIAEKSAIPYFELTERFKQLENKSAYFFKFDGHPNARGYEEIAKGIADQLIENYFIESKSMNRNIVVDSIF